jgi:hypothetical protein
MHHHVAPTWWCADGKGAPIFSLARTWFTLIPGALKFFSAGGIGSSPACPKHGVSVVFSTSGHPFWCADNNVCAYRSFPSSDIFWRRGISRGTSQIHIHQFRVSTSSGTINNDFVQTPKLGEVA